MKANRKFKEEKEAVSAVIGVILMVAITVAIAATVYVYVSGMLGGGSEDIPNIAFSKKYTSLTVTRADNNIYWDDPLTILFNIFLTIYKVITEKRYPHGHIQ